MSGLPSLMQAAADAAKADGVQPKTEDGAAAAADAAAAAATADDKPDEGAKDVNVDPPENNPPPLPPAEEPSALMQMMGGAVPLEALSGGGTAAKKKPLRRGKWTPEEEAYANRLIQEFKAGLLPLTDGTTLRTFLSKLLNCDPMRISKKFVGSNCIGKQVFRRRGEAVSNMSPEEQEMSRFELSELERKFLERVSSTKGSKGGGGRKGSKAAAAAGLGGMGGNMNKSAAAVGRALLQGGNASGAAVGNVATTGLMAQLQSQQPGMFDANTAQSFLSAAGASQAGGLGTMNTNNSIANLMLQTGMSKDQISQLASKGVSGVSSVSLANLLGKQRSFDQLMSLDFQSMQSIDNLANLIQAGMPNHAVPNAQKKNVDWANLGTPAAPAANPLANLASNPAASLLTGAGGTRNSIENLVRSLSANSGGSGTNAAASALNLGNQANATSFGNLLQGATAPGANLGTANASAADIGNLLQSLQQQQQAKPAASGLGNLGSLGSLGNLASLGNLGTLLQNPSGGNLGAATTGSGQNQNANDLMSMIGQASSHPNANPLLQQLNNPMGGLQNAAAAGAGSGNPVMAALAQQQLLAQGHNVTNLLGQQNQLAGLAGINNPLGNLAGLGNIGAGNNFAASGLGGANLNLGAAAGGANNSNAAALLQQLIAQQGANQGLAAEAKAAPAAEGAADAASGTKRAGEAGDEGEPPAKKQQKTASL